MMGNRGQYIDSECKVLYGPLGGHVLVVRGAKTIVGVPLGVSRSKKAKRRAKCIGEGLIALWKGLFGCCVTAEGVGLPWGLGRYGKV